MGFFNKKKKNKATEDTNNVDQIINCEIYEEELEGKIVKYLAITYYNPNNQDKDKKDEYDTTSVDIEIEPVILENLPTPNKNLHNCSIAWCKREVYDDPNAVLDYDGDYIIDVDLDLLKSNQEYAKFLITKILNKENVEAAKNFALSKDYLKSPGNYLGGVKLKDDKPYIIKDGIVGLFANNTDYMKEIRIEAGTIPDPKDNSKER